MSMNIYTRKKAVVTSLFVCSILVLVSTAMPVIAGSKISNIINKKDEVLSVQDEDIIVSNYLNTIYRSIELDKGFIKCYFSFIQQTLNYLESTDLSIFELHHIINKEMIEVYDEFNDMLNGKIANDQQSSTCSLVEKVEFLNENNNPLNQDDFETYWIKFRRAKGIWAGYYPNTNYEPDPRNNVKKYFWYGDNFYDWYEGDLGAALFLFGRQPGVDSQFEKNNRNYGLIGAVFELFGAYLVQKGFRAPGGDILLSTVGGIFAFCGSIFLGLLLVYDYFALTYFLFGVNSLIETIYFGNVNFVVNVVNNSGFPIDNCKITAYSVEADKKQGTNFEVGDWNISEFTYVLGKMESPYIGWYSLTERYVESPEEHPMEKFIQAVPPPGHYNLSIIPPDGWIGDDEDGIIINEIGPLSPNRSLNLTVVLDIEKKQ